MDLKITMNPTNRAIVVIDMGGFKVRINPTKVVSIPKPKDRPQLSKLRLFVKAKITSNKPAIRKVTPKNIANAKIESSGEFKTIIPIVIYIIPAISGMYQFLMALKTGVKK